MMWTNFALMTFGAFLIQDTTLARKYFRRPRVDQTCECGKSNEGVSNRIVGGVITEPHIFPWIVAIFHKKLLHCGGALINDRYILTAGHCVKWNDKRDLDIGLGMHDLENPNVGYLLPIDDIILNKQFESDFLHDTNDIALMRLKYPVRYSKTVSPLCLPFKGSEYEGRTVKVAGWGRVTASGEPSRYLRQASLKVMTWTTCSNTSFGDHLTKSMMCAYAADTDACQGDSGGPLLFEKRHGTYEIIGIVSWGIGCALPNSPGIYVKVTDYLNWIKAKTQDAIYCMST